MSTLSGTLLANYTNDDAFLTNHRRANLSRVGRGEKSVTGAEVSHVLR